MPSTGLDLRCDCRKATLLGVFQVEDSGDVYLHIKSWRGEKILVNAKIYGKVSVWCRNCQRYTTVNPRRTAKQEIQGH